MRLRNLIFFSTIFLTTFIIIPIAMCQSGTVINTYVCGSDTILIEMDDGWFVGASHRSGVMLVEDDRVTGKLDTMGLQKLVKNNGEISMYMLETDGDDIYDVMDDFCR